MHKPEKMGDKDIKVLTLEGNGSSSSGCMVVSTGMECTQHDIDMPRLDCKKMRMASPILVRGEKHDEGEEQELEEGEIPAEQGSDYGSTVRPSEGSQITVSATGQEGFSPSRPLLQEVSNSTNQGNLKSCQETDLKILCSAVTSSPAESSNKLNYIVPGACEHCQERRRKIELTQEREEENVVQTGKGHLKHAAPRAGGEPPGNVVRRNFDLNLLPDLDEDQEFTSLKDDHPGDVRQNSTSDTAATKHLLQTPNKVSAFSPYASSSWSPRPGVPNPAHLDSQSSRSPRLVMAPPQQTPAAPKAGPPQPPGTVLSMNAGPTVFRSMVAAVTMPPRNSHGRRRLIAAAAAGPSIIRPPFMIRARAPNMVQPPARLFVHYGIQHPQLMQQQQQQRRPAVRQQRQHTLQLFPKSS